MTNDVGLVTCSKQNHCTVGVGNLAIGTADDAGAVVRTNVATQTDADNAWLAKLLSIPTNVLGRAHDGVVGK